MARKVAPQYASSEEALQDLAANGGGGVVDSVGNMVNPDSYAQGFTYNGDGTLATASFTDGVNTWTQSFSYTSGNLTGISRWVKA